MKTVAQINIERLTRLDRGLIEDVRLALYKLRDSVRFPLQAYEGSLHTKLDRLELELADAIHAADAVLGNQLELLSEADRVKAIVKSSV